MPDKEALKGTPVFSEEGNEPKEGEQKGNPGEQQDQQSDIKQAAQQASTLLSLFNANSSWNAPAKMTNVWLREGLGYIPKQLQDRMLKWELVDFRPRSAAEKTASDDNADKLMVLPGLEVAHSRKKPVMDITWVQCFSHYTAAMAQSFPDCTYEP